jgi:hypothetical protein
MVLDPERLPAWTTFQPRPFPDANLLLLGGRQPALVDSGFVGHVGGNGLLQATGAGIAASAPDAQAVARRDPGCCQAEYLDQPVSPYTVGAPLHDGLLPDPTHPTTHPTRARQIRLALTSSTLITSLRAWRLRARIRLRGEQQDGRRGRAGP